MVVGLGAADPVDAVHPVVHQPDGPRVAAHVVERRVGPRGGSHGTRNDGGGPTYAWTEANPTLEEEGEEEEEGLQIVTAVGSDDHRGERQQSPPPRKDSF